MPLDIAMQNAQLKPTNVDNTNYLLCVGAVTIATAFLTIFSRNPIHSALYLVICFHNSGPLSSVELSISHCPYYRLLWSDYDFILFTIMLMNLNKENEFTNPELQD
jgi:NADH-quinone oxidoreductase subunit J